jgi:hypothetical protein
LTTAQGLRQRGQSVVLGDTYTLGPNIVNSLHLTWTRIAINRGEASDLINPTDLGVNMFVYHPHHIDLGVGDDFFAGGNSPAYFINNESQVADDVDIIRGRHHLALGVDVAKFEMNVRNNFVGNGQFRFSGQISGDALLDFMLGLDSSFRQGGILYSALRQSYVGTYIQDDLKVSERINIQLGLRWEPFLPANEKDFHSGQNWFFPETFASGQHTSVYTNAPPGWFYTGDPWGAAALLQFQQARTT